MQVTDLVRSTCLPRMTVAHDRQDYYKVYDDNTAATISAAGVVKLSRCSGHQMIQSRQLGTDVGRAMVTSKGSTEPVNQPIIPLTMSTTALRWYLPSTCPMDSAVVPCIQQ